jgi:hypothetical protein
MVHDIEHQWNQNVADQVNGFVMGAFLFANGIVEMENFNGVFGRNLILDYGMDGDVQKRADVGVRIKLPVMQNVGEFKCIDG